MGTVTDVGTYAGDGSHYVTFDQGGNVWEWNDEILPTFHDLPWAAGRLFRRAATPTCSPRVTDIGPNASFEHDFNVGFRVSSLAPIPEPSAYAAILGCLGLGLALTRVRRNCG